MIACLLTVVVVVSVWLDLRAAYRDTVAYWNSDLSNTADELASIETLWLIERRTDTEGIADNASTAQLLLRKAADGDLGRAQQSVQHEVGRMVRINGFVGGAVADTRCQVVVQSNIPVEAMSGIRSACRTSLASREFTIVTSSLGSRHVWLNLAFPVFLNGPSRTNQGVHPALGATVMLAEPWKSTFGFFWRGNGSGRLAHTVIVWKDGNDAVRFSPESASHGRGSALRLPLSGAGLEPLVARQGRVRFGEFADHGGTRVLAVARPVALARASVVREIDLDQALADFRRRALMEWVAGALAILLFGSVIVAQRRHEAARELRRSLRQQKVLLDLKQQVEASERALRQSDQRYKAFLSHSHEGLWRIELNQPISTALPAEEAVQRLVRHAYLAECNLAFAHNLGFSGPEEMVGKSLGDLFSLTNPSDERLESIRSAVVEGFRNRSVEFRTADQKGRLKWFRRTEIPIVENGNLVRVWGTTSDITERKKAEDALRESEERFRTTFENAGIGMATIDMQGRLMKSNPALQRMLGYEEEELSRTRFAELIHPGDRRLDSKLYLDLAAGKRNRYEIETRYTRKDGTVAWGLLNVSLIKDTSGAPAYAVGMVEDITERRNAAEELQRSFKQLRALADRLQTVREEERKTVAREIHDELGQALTALKLDLRSLTLDLVTMDQRCLAKTDAVMKLIDDSIQSVRRISAELRPGLLDDLGLVAAVEWAAEEFARRTGIKCSLNLPSDDFAVAPEHATAIFRIFQETLTNVARHANANEVNVRMAFEDGHLCLEVRDNGIGISSEQLSAAGSLGILGMRERALSLDGELIIRGTRSGGTTVRVRIPETYSS